MSMDPNEAPRHPAGRDDRNDRNDRERILERIIARYIDDARAGRAPAPADLLRRHPAYADELSEFLLYYHAVAADLPEPEPAPSVAATLAPAAQAALGRIHQQLNAPALAGLVSQGIVAGIRPPQLAAAVGLSPDLLAKLDVRAIAARGIPRTLVKRLADALHVSAEAVGAYLGGGVGTQAGAFFYAEQAPTQEQESFVDALRASALPPERQREWEEIAAREARGA